MPVRRSDARVACSRSRAIRALKRAPQECTRRRAGTHNRLAGASLRLRTVAGVRPEPAAAPQIAGARLYRATDPPVT
jgi:hypothetical protein